MPTRSTSSSQFIKPPHTRSGLAADFGPNLLLRRRPIPTQEFTPTAEQMAAIAHRGSPLAVYGGPGTGKSATLIEAVISRVNDGVDPNSILILTYGRDRASELRDAIAIRAGSTSFEPLSRTFHSLAFSILNEKLTPDDRSFVLLSGAEQDAFIKDLLDNESSGITWHPDLAQAVTTQGFVRELRDLISRATEMGLSPNRLAELGKRLASPYWESAAAFWASYSDAAFMRDATVSEGPIRIDTAQNILFALDQLRSNPELCDRYRKRYRTIFVDEFQESDRGQRALLKELAGEELVIFCDPDSATGRFRGADPDGAMEWLSTFPHEITLSEVFRSGPELTQLGVEVAQRFRSNSPTRKRYASERANTSAAESQSKISLAQFPGHGESAGYIAYTFRKAHLEEGVPWSEMAVIIRSPGEQVAAIQRAFSQHHIPLSVEADAMALSENSAIKPFLLAANFVLHPDQLHVRNWAKIEELLLSEFCGADSIQLRHIRALFAKARIEEDERTTTQMMVDAITDPITLDIDESAIIPLIRLRNLLQGASKSRHEISELLWSLWSGAVNYQNESIKELWRSRALKGGARGAAADRDLDSMIQLFEAARRFGERMQGAKPAQFLEQIAGERLESDAISFSAQREEVVSLLTVHGAKGQEWQVVALPGLQEGEWPNLKARGSLLGSERLSDYLRTGIESAQELAASTAAALVEDERRLLHSAVTRAKERLIVTAVSAEESQPSRYFEELFEFVYKKSPDEAQPMELPRALTEQALVATLRSELLTEDLNSARAVFLARLLKRIAREGLAGADPKNWLGVRELSTDLPLVDSEHQVFISPSGIQSFLDCELKWFLEKSGAQNGDSNQQLLGTAIHALAALKHENPALTVDQAKELILSIWSVVGSTSGWIKEYEQRKAIRMIQRFFEWHDANPRTLIAVEQPFLYEEGRATVSGSVDRLELDEATQSLFIVDLKTGQPVTAQEALEHRQLMAYQLAIQKGAWVAKRDENGEPIPAPELPPITQAGGAELLFLAKKNKSVEGIGQPALKAEEFIPELHRVAQGMAGSAFAAKVNDQCGRCHLRSLCPLQAHGKSVIE